MTINVLTTPQIYTLSEKERYDYFSSLDYEVAEILRTIPECDKERFITTLNTLISNGTDKELLKTILRISFNAGETANNQDDESSMLIEETIN